MSDSETLSHPKWDCKDPIVFIPTDRRTALYQEGRHPLEGKAALYIARTSMRRRKNDPGHQFWARGYDVSTVGRDEATIRECICTQEADD